MKKSMVFLLCTTFFSVGVTLGFVLSPIKKGISIGNNSGNYYGKKPENEHISEQYKKRTFV